jgi:CDGSH-type Zn-finger protein
MKKKAIKIIENGPYLVTGDVPLKRENSIPDESRIPIKWEKRGSIKSGESVILCRCGKSKTKPFCDQSHIKVGFKGKEVASNIKFNEQANTIEGSELTLKDADSFCAVARFCELDESVWNLVEHSSDPKKKKLAIQESCNCPSGRLIVYDRKTGKKIEPKFDKEICVTEDTATGLSGPLWVKGGIPVEGADGKKYEVRNRVTLCRCGKSKNKPFCDGEHLNTRFVDENRVL